MDDRRRVQLNSVTIYVQPADFEATRDFYRAILDVDPIFEQPGHISCFPAGPEHSICVHESGELGREPGEIEVIYWVDDLGAFDANLPADTARRELAGGALELEDPGGRRLRFQERPGS
jgi:catechol 2,3-dioxygenase-like lactoylglutathione lyase family enzyme